MTDGEIAGLPAETAEQLVRRLRAGVTGAGPDAVAAELRRRLAQLEPATEAQRLGHMEKFAFSAAVVIRNLWEAHNGKPLTDDQLVAFGKLLFNFLLKGG